MEELRDVGCWNDDIKRENDSLRDRQRQPTGGLTHHAAARYKRHGGSRKEKKKKGPDKRNITRPWDWVSVKA